MMSNKLKFKQIVLAASVALMASTPTFASDSNIESLKQKLSENGGSEYVSDAEFKRAMEELAKQEVLMTRQAKVRNLKAESSPSESEQDETREKSLEEKLNPPKDAKEVSIEFFDLMEKEYQQHLFELRQEIDVLKDRIKSLKDPKNLEMIQDHIYVTEIYGVGSNKYATVMWNFHFFEDTTEGEEIIPGVVVSEINDKGITITKEDGSKHFIIKISKRRALENAWAAKNDKELEYLNSRSQVDSPNEINIRPPMGLNNAGGGMPFGGGQNGGAGTQLPIFPQ